MLNPNSCNILCNLFRVVCILLFSSQVSFLLAEEPNYDESKVPEYTLPNPLQMLEGAEVTSSQQWIENRRPEILELFRKHVYGRSPEKPKQIEFEVYEQSKVNQAIRKQVAITITHAGKSRRLEMLVFLPEKSTKPTPVFLLLNFKGNHAVTTDPSIAPPKSELPERYSPAEKFRGDAKDRFPIDDIVARGYGVATIYCGDIDPDYHDDFKNGVHALYPYQGKRPEDAWGTISAWAWGLSRAVDYFEQDADIDHQHVAVLGHSRLGKTALWAGAQDERFALVISNNSGCGGAALSRRRFGEKVKRINDVFPHWFCKKFKHYNDNENALPVDQHMLIALAAPRPVYVASASADRWADPRGEFLSCVHAGAVYNLFGLKGLEQDQMPETNHPIQTGHVGYHLRDGKHQLTAYDWNAYMDFADKHWRKQ